MLTLRLLVAMLSGRLAQWEKTEALGLGGLLGEFQAETGSRRRAVDQFLNAANVLLKDLILNLRGLKLPVRVNPKNVSPEQMREAHKILLTVFVAVYAASTPSVKSEMEALLANPIFDPVLTEDLLSFQDEAKSLGDPEPPQDSQLVKTVWAHIVRALGAGDPTDAKQISRFSALLTQRYRTTTYFMNK